MRTRRMEDGVRRREAGRGRSDEGKGGGEGVGRRKGGRKMAEGEEEDGWGDVERGRGIEE